MPGKRTLGSMMNPQPMQFAMGAKMYQRGTGSGRAVGGRAPAGVSSMGYSKEELAQLAQMKEAFAKAGGMNTAEGRAIAVKARALQDKISPAEVYERYSDEFPQMSSPQTPGGMPQSIPPGALGGMTEAPTNTPGSNPPPQTGNMMRKLQQYLKGGKTDAGLKALAESNPNLTYKEAMNGMRLIKDPVGMKSAGHGRKMYQNGTGDAEGGPAYMGADKPMGYQYRDDLPEGRIDPNDPGFQEFLKNYGGEYFEEYHGMPIGGSSGGGSIYGQTSKYGEISPDTGLPYERGDRSAGYFDVLGGTHKGDMQHNLAINPAMFAMDMVGETHTFLDRQLAGGREGSTNRDLADRAVERYNQNLAAEQAYRDYLAKQKGPTERGKSYQVIRRPGQSDAFTVK